MTNDNGKGITTMPCSANTADTDALVRGVGSEETVVPPSFLGNEEAAVSPSGVGSEESVASSNGVDSEAPAAPPAVGDDDETAGDVGPCSSKMLLLTSGCPMRVTLRGVSHVTAWTTRKEIGVFDEVRIVCGEDTADVSLPEKDLDSFDYASILPRMQLCREDKRRIADTIRTMAHTSGMTEVDEIDRIGLYDLGAGQWRLVLGDSEYRIPGVPDSYRVISPAAGDHVADSVRAAHYDVEPLDESEAATMLVKAMNVSPGVTDVIMAALATAFLRPLKDAYLASLDVAYPLIYIQGRSGSYKTSFVEAVMPRFRTPGGTAHNVMRASDTPAAIREALDYYKDFAVFVDDINRASDAIARTDIGHVLQILREYADETGRTTVRKDYRINSLLVVSGETGMDRLTNLGRVVMIRVKEKLDRDKLEKLQDRGNTAYNAAWLAFVGWVYANADRVSVLLYNYVESERMGSHEWRNMRFADNVALLRVGYILLRDFAREHAVFVDDGIVDEQTFVNTVERFLRFQEYLMAQDEEVDEASLRRRRFKEDPAGYLYDYFIRDGGYFYDEDGNRRERSNGGYGVFRLQTFDGRDSMLELSSLHLKQLLNDELEVDIGNKLHVALSELDLIDKGDLPKKLRKRTFCIDVVKLKHASENAIPLPFALKRRKLTFEELEAAFEALEERKDDAQSAAQTPAEKDTQDAQRHHNRGADRYPDAEEWDYGFLHT